MKTILPYIVLVGLVAYMILSPKEKEIVDKTDYYEAKNDSLITINKALHQMIDTRDDIIEEKQKEADSLLLYQDKIYIYYENILENLDTLSDSEQLELFYTLTD